MSKKNTELNENNVEEILEETAEVQETETVEEVTVEVNPFEEKYNAERDAHLRLAAEYDNFRKRTAKEKDAAYTHGKSDAVAKLLPVYDNLERALNQPTEDAAYKKGVEMTMNELVKMFTSSVMVISTPFLKAASSVGWFRARSRLSYTGRSFSTASDLPLV